MRPERLIGDALRLMLQTRRPRWGLAAGGTDEAVIVPSLLLAHWSANGSNGALALNRVAGSPLGPLHQPNGAEQPATIALPNGVAALQFDGARAMHSSVLASATPPWVARRYLAWHLRATPVVAGCRAFYSEYDAAQLVQFAIALRGEQILIAYRVEATGRLNSYVVPIATQRFGMFLEVIPNLGVSPWLRLFVNGAEVAARFLSGKVYSAQPGNTFLWLGSDNGAGVQAVCDIAHVMLSNNDLTGPERAEFAAFEAPVWDQPWAAIPALVAHWSALGATTASVPNGAGGVIGAFTQETAGDRPTLVALPNGVQVLRFDGVSQDLHVDNVPALSAAAERWYFAFHIRIPSRQAGVIYSEWYTGGASVVERLRIETDGFNNIVVSIGVRLSGGTTQLSSIYPVSLSTQKSGFLLEIIFDGPEGKFAGGTTGSATLANNIAARCLKLFASSLEVARIATSVPDGWEKFGVSEAQLTDGQKLLAGDAPQFWLGSQNGANNREMDVANFFVMNETPSLSERATLDATNAPDWGPAPAFHPEDVGCLIAFWSGNGSTVALVPNRIPGSTVGALEQPIELDRPFLMATPNGTQYLRFDGSRSDLWTPSVPALKSTGPRHYWMFQLRPLGSQSSSTRSFYSEWTSGGGSVAERMDVAFDGYRLQLNVATSATLYAQKVWFAPLALMGIPVCIEILFDSALAEPNKWRAYFNGVISISGSGSGTPGNVLAGDAQKIWIGSKDGSNNSTMDLAHLCIGTDIPTDAERAELRAFELPDWEDSPLVTVPIVSSWLRNIAAAGVSIASVPDRLNPASPAIQTVPARQPAAINGGAMVFDSPGDVLLWPLHAGNNNPTQWGLGLSTKPAAVGINQMVYAVASIALNSATRIRIFFSTTNGIIIDFYLDAGGVNGRRATVSSGVSNVTQTLLIEFNAAHAVEASRLVITQAGSNKTFTLSSLGTGIALGPMVDSVGHASLFAQTDADTPVLPFVGQLGRDIVSFSTAEPAATTGLFTPSTRRLVESMLNLGHLITS